MELYLRIIDKSGSEMFFNPEQLASDEGGKFLKSTVADVSLAVKLDRKMLDGYNFNSNDFGLYVEGEFVANGEVQYLGDYCILRFTTLHIKEYVKTLQRVGYVKSGNYIGVTGFPFRLEQLYEEFLF